MRVLKGIFNLFKSKNEKPSGTWNGLDQFAEYLSETYNKDIGQVKDDIQYVLSDGYSLDDMARDLESAYRKEMINKKGSD